MSTTIKIEVGNEAPPTLSVREHANGFSLVVDIEKPSEWVIANGIPGATMARKFCAAPALIDAAVFAASVIKTGGMYDMSEQMAFEKLEAALSIAGVKINTVATRQHDAFTAQKPTQTEQKKHPDTVRLNHIIKQDRCAIGYLNGATENGGLIEKIEFIFENHASDTGPDVVRSAIDESIQANQRNNGGLY